MINVDIEVDEMALLVWLYEHVSGFDEGHYVKADALRGAMPHLSPEQFERVDTFLSGHGLAGRTSARPGLN